VQPDFLAINLGQRHGSNYDYAHALQIAHQLSDLEQERGADDRRLLVAACGEIDRQMDGLGFPWPGSERTDLREIQTLAIGSCNSLTATLDQLGRLEEPWKARVLEAWHRLCHESTRHHAQLVDEGLGYGLKDGIASDEVKGLLNHTLLDEMAALVRHTHTRLALHGGTSIARSSRLQLAHKVARVNFGSSVFSAFAAAALSQKKLPKPISQLSRIDVATLVDAEASDWHHWLEKPPRFMEPFEKYLEHEFFQPLGASRSLFDGMLPL
jgi:hypothetical protein